jgi:hypothetical protein
MPDLHFVIALGDDYPPRPIRILVLAIVLAVLLTWLLRRDQPEVRAHPAD